MSRELIADFEKRFAGPPPIRFAMRRPAEGFAVTALFDPSGCGRTTALRCLAGLDRPEDGGIEFAGDVWFDARHDTHRRPQSRDIGLLFQDYALFPHLTVASNIAYGLPRTAAAQSSRRIVESSEERRV